MLVPFVSQGEVSRMFAGFTSRWTSPAPCAVSNASATGARMPSACFGSNAPQSLATGQVAAPHVAHRDVEQAVVLAGLVDRNDVGVIEGGGEPGLPHESLAKIGVVRDFVAQNLQGDRAVQSKVGGS